MDFFGTLKAKWHGVPVYIIALAGVMGLALYLKRRNSTSSSATTAANQTNTNLGTAGQMSNQFWLAGMMPFQGGNVYVTQTNTSPGATKPPAKKGGGPIIIDHPPGHYRPPVKPPVHPVPGKKKPLPSQVDYTYHVKKNDTLSGIAKHYGLTTAQLWNFNTGTNPANSAMRPKSTIATLKKRGPNLIFPNETLAIPKKGTVYAGGA